MVRIFLITFLLILSLQARENPFFPSTGEEDLPYTSNKKINIPNLKQASITLPSTARTIKKVTIEYEKMDASIESKSIDLEHTVDWHLPIFVSQSYNSEKNHIEEKKDTPIVTPVTPEMYKSVGKIKYSEFHVLGKSLKIITEDKIIRNFLLAQPHRIVMDFKRESSMKSYFQDIKDSVFTKVRVGNHKGYYRVVIELDGYYRYKFEKIDNGCLLTLE